MTPITCATFLASLKAAAAGAVLALPAGPCPMPTLNGVNPPGVVRITSQNPSNPAILAGDFKIANSSNLAFSQLVVDFSTTDDPYWAGRMSDIKNVSFDQVEIRSSGPTVAWPGGFDVTDSDHFAVTNSKVHDIGSAAFNILRATNATISGNDFYRWGKSAVGAGQVQNFTFSNNKVHDAFPVIGTHADGLQILTAGTTAQSNGLTITGNHLWTGQGWAFQGLFIQDELGTMPICNVRVTGNLLYGTMWDSLWLKNVCGTNTVANNLMISWPQPDIDATTDLTKPVITAFTANLNTWVAAGATLTMTGNMAQSFSDANGKWVAALPGNTKLGVAAN